MQPVILSLGAVFGAMDLGVLDVQSIEWKSLLDGKICGCLFGFHCRGKSSGCRCQKCTSGLQFFINKQEKDATVSPASTGSAKKQARFKTYEEVFEEEHTPRGPVIDPDLYNPDGSRK